MTATLLQAWRDTLSRAPIATALIDATTGSRLTRAELDTTANAWHEQHAPLARRRAVAFAETNSPAWLRVFLGLLKSDAALIPLDPGDPPAAQRTTARAAGASFFWNGETLEPLAPHPRRLRDARRIVKLTSGSTGTPRALPFTDAEMLADGQHICAGMRIAADDINLGLIPWGHSYGLGNLILPLILQGTPIVHGVTPLPHAIAAAVKQTRATVFPAVPALLQALAESTVAPTDLSSLRTIVSAGAPLAPEVARAFHARFDRKVHNFYGSSETGGISYDASGDSAAHGRGVGRPLPGVTLAFSRGRRFTVSSDAVFTLRNRHPGAHRMADLARLDASGELVLLGRSGRAVKIAGRRLNLAEVERALRELPGVRDAFVAPHPERADALAAVVATDRSPAELREGLRERLASWKIPKKIVALPTFPLTARGKPDTQRLRELIASAPR
jgi:acyl-CoA synthetase (AMP-forming)/AMP-acid ligase II